MRSLHPTSNDRINVYLLVWIFSLWPNTELCSEDSIQHIHYYFVHSGLNAAGLQQLAWFCSFFRMKAVIQLWTGTQVASCSLSSTCCRYLWDTRPSAGDILLQGTDQPRNTGNTNLKQFSGLSYREKTTFK